MRKWWKRGKTWREKTCQTCFAAPCGYSCCIWCCAEVCCSWCENEVTHPSRNWNNVTARCVLCRRFEFTVPLPPALPRFRVQESRPLSHTALDFASPLNVKTFGVTRSKKMWICLYMCCVTCAVHIDVVPDMSTETFVRSLKRFCARWGTPLVIVSDNAKTFRAAAKVIQNVITHPDVKRYCSELSIKWHFNLEKAPWWGGMYERMIKSTKRCLRKMVGQAHFTHDELLTALVETEVIIKLTLSPTSRQRT